MNEVAVELGCDWHTVNDAVVAYGTVLVDDPARIGQPTALGLDETLFCREGPWRHQSWSTSIVDVASGRLLDVVAGRGAVEPCRWLAARGEAWCERIAWGTLDLSGSYRAVFDTMLPDATQIADPFHLVKVRHEAPCLRVGCKDPPPGCRSSPVKQLRQFLEEIDDHRLAPAFFLAANTGMRRGEVLGLRWDDVDLDAARISLRHAVLNVAYELVLADVKTKTSRRTIGLDPRTVAVLRAWRRVA